MRISEYKKQIVERDPLLAKRLESDISHQIGKMLIRARLLRGVTQERLAELAKTKQPSIARIESGSQMPSLSFLEKVVNSMGYTLLPPRIAELDESSGVRINYGSGQTTSHNAIKSYFDTVSLGAQNRCLSN